MQYYDGHLRTMFNIHLAESMKPDRILLKQLSITHQWPANTGQRGGQTDIQR